MAGGAVKPISEASAVARAPAAPRVPAFLANHLIVELPYLQNLEFSYYLSYSVNCCKLALLDNTTH